MNHGADKNMNSNLLILGAGQYGSVVEEIAQSMGFYEKTDFLDDSFGENSKKRNEAVIGKFGDSRNYVGVYQYAIVAIGDPELRRKLTENLKKEGFQIPVLISPKAYVSPSAKLREGCIVEPLAAVNANSVIGTGTIISAGAVVNHNCSVGDYCHIDCGAVMESGAIIESGCKAVVVSVVRRKQI